MKTPENVSSTEQTLDPSKQKLKIRERIAFGLGDFGTNYSWTYVTAFLTIYLTDVVGMAAGIIGTIVLIARLFDGVTDLFMGNIIDRTNSKMGKARPWVFWTAPLVGLSTFLLFNVPTLGNTGQIVYVFGLYLLLSACFMTASNIAYGSLVSFMTTNPVERVKLGSIRYLFAAGSILLITSFTYPIVDFFGGGQQGWTITSLIYVLLCVIPLMITGWFVKERNVAKVADDSLKVGLLPMLKALFTNKYFILVLVLYIVNYLKQARTSVQIFYASYVLGSAGLMGILSFTSILPTFIGLMFAPAIVARIGGLKKSLIIGQVITIIGGIIQVFLSENIIGLSIGLAIMSLGGVFLLGCLNAIVADIGDLVYWKSGLPAQAAAFSISSVGMKVGTGIATGMVGWILAKGAYVPNATNQPDSSILAMKFLFIYLPLICAILVLIIALFLNYEKFIGKVREGIKMGKVGESRDESIVKN